jgi:hypothetical protein
MGVEYPPPLTPTSQAGDGHASSLSAGEGLDGGGVESTVKKDGPLNANPLITS